MKRVAIIADSHFDEHSRWAETCRLHEWIEADIQKRGVDAVIHTGDVFERKSTPTERNRVADWLCAVAEHAPVLIVRGNHDALGDLAIFGELRSKHRIEVEEAAGMHLLGGVRIAAIAWPRKAHLLAGLSQAGHEETEQAAADALRDVLRGFAATWNENDSIRSVPNHPPRVLAMHAMVRGSVTSVGQPLVGCDLEVGLDDLALAQAQFVALGHIHKGQDWQLGDAPIVYPGSPRRTSFGELEAKGYVVASFDGGIPQWERIVVPATPMLLAEGAWSAERASFGDEVLASLGTARVPGAEIRLRYEVSAEHRDAAKRAAADLRERLIADGAVVVKVEEVVTATVRARAPEVAKARTLGEKLEAMWRARAVQPEAEQAARLLGKVTELQTEVAA